MPSTHPQFLMKRIQQAKENPGTLVVHKKNGFKPGTLEILLKENGELRVQHFGTLILLADIHYKEVVSTGGAFSQTDCRYINCILDEFNMGRYYSANIVKGEFQFTDERGKENIYRG